MLAPCPAGFAGRSVREVRARRWPHGTCFAVQGRLTAAVATGQICNMRLQASRAGEASEPPHCARGWVLTDSSDPPIVEWNELTEPEDAPQSLSLLPVGSYEPWLLPLERCNRDGDGTPVMPASTRFDLPLFRYFEASALNAGLAGITVGVFGGKNARDFDPDKLDDFQYLVETHVCRL
jgi:hypothetical protein